MLEAPINRQDKHYFIQDAESQPFIAPRLAFAQPIVRDAAALAMALRPAPGGPAASLKGRQDYVTEADKAVEKLISARIKALYPGMALSVRRMAANAKVISPGLLTRLTAHPISPVGGTGGACLSVSFNRGDRWRDYFRTCSA